MLRMALWLAISVACCTVTTAAAAPQAQTLESSRDYEKALDLIHAYSGSGGELRLASEIIVELAKSDAKSGYSQTLLAEALSTWRLEQDGTPAEVRDQVIALADEAIRLNPDLAQAYVAKGRALVRSSEYPEANAQIDHALVLDPHLSGALFLRADVFRRQGSLAEAEKWYRAFIDSTSSPSRKGNGYGWIGSMYESAADNDALNRDIYVQKARQAFEQGLELKPGGAWDNVNFAIFLNSTAADFDGAEKYALRALALMDFPMARVHLAAARYQRLWANKSVAAGPELEKQLRDVAKCTGMTLEEVREFDGFGDLILGRLNELASRRGNRVPAI